VKANQATHPVRVMCRLLKISRSGFYALDTEKVCRNLGLMVCMD